MLDTINIKGDGFNFIGIVGDDFSQTVRNIMKLITMKNAKNNKTNNKLKAYGFQVFLDGILITPLNAPLKILKTQKIEIKEIFKW